MHIDVYLRGWSGKPHKKGLKLHNTKSFRLLLIANDQVSKAEVEKDTTCMFRKLNYSYDGWELKINRSKTKNVLISLKANILFYDVNIKTVEKFKFLESIIHQDRSWQRNVEKRVFEAETQLQCSSLSCSAVTLSIKLND